MQFRPIRAGPQKAQGLDAWTVPELRLLPDDGGTYFGRKAMSALWTWTLYEKIAFRSALG